MKCNFCNYIVIIFLFLFVNETKAQWILNDSIKRLGSFGSATFSINGEVYSCGIPYLTNDSLIDNFYLREDLTDLVYFTQTGKNNIIRVAGYYKKKFEKIKIEEARTCWVKDLVWYYYDCKGYLLKVEFYNNGKLVQPTRYSR